MESLAHQFWKRFIQEYVPTLIRRSKWRTRGRQIKVGDIVLLVDFNAPQGKWNLALVKDVYPGADGVISTEIQISVTLKLTSGHIVITSICKAGNGTTRNVVDLRKDSKFISICVINYHILLFSKL